MGLMTKSCNTMEVAASLSAILPLRISAKCTGPVATATPCMSVTSRSLVAAPPLARSSLVSCSFSPNRPGHPSPFSHGVGLTQFAFIGINSNYGDSATISDMDISDVKTTCQTYTGTDDNDEEPSENDDNGGGCDGTYCIC